MNEAYFLICIYFFQVIFLTLILFIDTRVESASNARYLHAHYDELDVGDRRTARTVIERLEANLFGGHAQLHARYESANCTRRRTSRTYVPVNIFLFKTTD